MRIKMSFIILVLILGLAGCNKQSLDATDARENKPGETGQDIVTGKYVEDIIDISDGIDKVMDIRSGKDETLTLLFISSMEELCLYESYDNGITWEKNSHVSNDFLLEGFGIVSACIGSNGYIYISAGKISENSMMESFTGDYIYYEISTGESDYINQLNIEIPEPIAKASSNGYGMTNLQVTDSGQLYGVLKSGEEEDSKYELVGFDIESQTQLLEKQIESGEIKIFENEIYVVANSGYMQNYNIERDKYGSPVEINLLNTQVDIDVNNKMLFYCNTEGVYSADYEMAFTQQLINGADCSISESGNEIEKFIAVDETVFLVFTRRYTATGVDDLRLYRYEYDADFEIKADNQLNIYSLRENDTVKNIISRYKQHNTDITISYQVGLNEDGIQNVSDAINTLNTEIIAGNGPDIIILNGLPWESYMQKGMFEDVSDVISGYLNEGELFEQPFDVLKNDNSHYAVPVGIRVPVILGDTEYVNRIYDLATLIQAVEKTEDTLPLMQSNKDLLTFFVSTEWSNVKIENNQIDMESLGTLLNDIKTLNDMIGNDTYDQEEDDIYDDFFYNNYGIAFSSAISYGNALMSTGYVTSVLEYIAVYNHGNQINTISDDAFSALLIGVNATTDSTVVAKDFVSFCLSEELQGMFFNDRYLPVNKSAYQNMTQEPSVIEIEELGHLITEWPGQEYFDQLEIWISNFNKLTMEDSIIVDTVIESSKSYLAGSKSLDTAVEGIVQSLNLYLIE